MSKAQVITGDFVISMLVFMILLAMIIPVWSYVDYQIRSSEEVKSMNSIVMLISDSFVRSGGYPADWNSTNVKSIGLADRDRELNLTKVLNLLEMNYNTAKKLMGIEAYEIYLTITDTDDNIINKGGQDLEYGSTITDAENIVKMRRVSILDREIVILNIIVWN